MRIPILKDFGKALQIYYSTYELRAKDIMDLFGVASKKACDLKAHAKAYAKENGVTEINSSTVDTAAAFKSWGIDIKEIERRYKKLRDLDMESGQAVG